MKKNGRTLRQDAAYVKRGLREFDNILPGQMRKVYAKSVLVSCIPYIGVIMSAMIIDELTQGRSEEKLLWLCGISVGATCFFSLLKGYLETKIAVGYSHLFSAHELYLTEKSCRLPYEYLERNEIKELREQVSGSLNVSGAGIASLYWDMEVVVTNVCSAVISLALCVGLVKELAAGNASGHISASKTAGTVLTLSALILICCFVACRMMGKRFDVSFEVFLNGAKYNRYGEFYTMNYLPDENAALDIRIFQQGKLILEESQKKCYKPFAEGKRREMKALRKYEGIKLLCTCICGTVIYLTVGQRALQGDIGIGSIVKSYAAVTMLITAFSELAQIITDLRNNNEHLRRLFQYMDLPENEDIPAARTKPEETGGYIIFDHVSFKYQESASWVLEDINLTVTKGERLAVVGTNGSGKTTLMKLLCRLYKPTKGRICLNGKDIWSYSYAEYIRSISAVFQDFSLFAFTLARNVAASDNYERERVEKALDQAGLGQKREQMLRGIEQTLFHDYEEDGTDLSGGEAQKTAIARALYKEADVMILDEPTAALDPYAEYDIYRNFHRITSGKTVFSISHRLSSCRMCDKIAVMDKGRIIQYGTHEELVMQKTKKYYEMWRAQAQYYT